MQLRVSISGRAQGRILIAEDDEDFGRLLVRRAGRLGLKVTYALNATDAIAVLKEQKFDLLAVDMYMPGGTGLEVIAAAQKADPDIHAIILTASSSLENAIDALRAGVFEYLRKPLDSIAEFDIAVLRALERRNLIRENKRLFEENKRLASLDPLTGLFNRYEMHKRLSDEIEREKRYTRGLSILMIDLDHFKEINDRYGHVAGDRVLRSVAKAIRRTIRRVDYAARFGGDEFLVIMPEAGLDTAMEVALRISEESARPIEGIGKVGISIGVAAWKDKYKTIEAFIQAADERLYQGKIKRASKVDSKVNFRETKGAGMAIKTE